MVHIRFSNGGMGHQNDSLGRGLESTKFPCVKDRTPSYPKLRGRRTYRRQTKGRDSLYRNPGGGKGVEGVGGGTWYGLSRPQKLGLVLSSMSSSPSLNTGQRDGVRKVIEDYGIPIVCHPI